MRIELLVTPQPNTAGEFSGKTVVVFDVLRATSSIITALGNGALEVIPVIEPGEAMELMRSIGAQECITGGERKGLKIEGFELGNSPAEYSNIKVSGKKVILCTSNGTRAIKWAQGAAEVLIGSYLNLQTLVDYLKGSDQEIVLICAGSGVNIGLEDLACAGRLIQLLQTAGVGLELNDAAYLARLSNERSLSIGLEAFIGQTDHGKYLSEIGMTEDLKVCTSIDSVPILPKFVDGRITI